MEDPGKELDALARPVMVALLVLCCVGSAYCKTWDIGSFYTSTRYIHVSVDESNGIKKVNVGVVAVADNKKAVHGKNRAGTLGQRRLVTYTLSQDDWHKFAATYADAMRRSSSVKEGGDQHIGTAGKVSVTVTHEVGSRPSIFLYMLHDESEIYKQNAEWGFCPCCILLDANGCRQMSNLIQKVNSRLAR